MKLGLHISTAGNLAGTPSRAKATGAETIQLFGSNPRGWKPTLYTDNDAAAFRTACDAEGIDPAFFHMIYLVNYGTPNDEMRAKSITALTQTLRNADQLGIRGVVTHLGSHKGLGLEQALQRLSSAILESFEGSSASMLLLENSAGAGGNIGNSLEELGAIIDATGKHSRVGVCIDTCHALAAGYEIRTKPGLDSFLSEFDRLIGLDRLVAMHLNDTKADIASKLDRHENIGDGHIGYDGFRVIINHPALAHIAGILEVPGLEGKGPDKGNLDRLKDLLT